MRRAAFTLVELLIVIIILGVLAAIVVPKFTQSGERTKQSARATNLKVLRGAVSRFYDDTGAYPAALADLAVTTSPATGLSLSAASFPISAGSWNGPYVHKVFNDPITGTAYVYSTTAPVGKVTAPSSGGGPVVVEGGELN